LILTCCKLQQQRLLNNHIFTLISVFSFLSLVRLLLAQHSPVVVVLETRRVSIQQGVLQQRPRIWKELKKLTFLNSGQFKAQMMKYSKMTYFILVLVRQINLKLNMYIICSFMTEFLELNGSIEAFSVNNWLETSRQLGFIFIPNPELTGGSVVLLFYWRHSPIRKSRVEICWLNPYFLFINNSEFLKLKQISIFRVEKYCSKTWIYL